MSFRLRVQEREITESCNCGQMGKWHLGLYDPTDLWCPLSVSYRYVISGLSETMGVMLRVV